MPYLAPTKSEPRLDAIAKDLVWHFNERGYQGKAMYVALDKPTAVRMHKLVMWESQNQNLVNSRSHLRNFN